MANYDDLNNKRIFAVAILSVVVVAVSALAVQVLYYWMVRLQETSTAEMSAYRRENAVLAAQDEEIRRFGVDEQTAAITMPIDDAIQQVLQQRQDKKQMDANSEDA